jgi:hypothetical protein
MKLFGTPSAIEPLDLLPFLAGVDLSDSFVLTWTVDSDQLLFQLDASLWPENPNYEQPKPGEHTCYKPATLAFLGVVRLSLPDPIQASAAYDSVEHGYDTIDFISYSREDRLWRVEVGCLHFSFGCSGMRFDVSAA